MGQVAAYSRSQEAEADRLGQGLAAISGYDPDGMARFLRNLENTERLRLGFSRFTTFRDTHPATKERVAAAGARARSIAWTPKPGFSRDRNDYLHRLDGLPLGMGGADGVFHQDRFLHADLDFSIRFPQSWRLVNTKQAVGAIHPQLRGYVVLEMEGRGDDPEAAAAKYIEKAREDGLGIDTLERVRIGQWNAVRATGGVNTPGGPISVHLTFIARDGWIYRLMGVSRGSAGAMNGIFNSTARSFRALKPQEMKLIEETRLKIVPAKAGETLPELARRTGNTWDIQETALMNAIYATDRLEEGQLMKVAISRPYRPGPKPR
jgi:predicted Zn-dependent protease